MNLEQYLLVCLIEELSEVQKELSKCLRFTTDHKPEEYKSTNLERARLEVADVYAIASMLKEHCNIDIGLNYPERMPFSLLVHMAQKVSKTNELINHSVRLGVLK